MVPAVFRQLKAGESDKDLHSLVSSSRRSLVPAVCRQPKTGESDKDLGLSQELRDNCLHCGEIESVRTGVINGKDAEFGFSRMVLEQCLLVGDVLNALLLLQ